MNPRFPVYIISKGRWKRRQTVRTMETMGVPYKIVVEPSEYEKYADVISPDNILVLPSDFSELNQGSVPARNWVWNHAVLQHSKWHWILDDNIESVNRFEHNMWIPAETGTPFYVIEDFVLRYQNIAQAGMNYATFCPAYEARPPVKFNTRIYSCILICNGTHYAWRGKYNEDTDLSIRMLKDGWVTVLFNQFLIGKRSTMTQRGGNEKIYGETDNRLEFAQSLVDQHPDVVTLTKRNGRWHHKVNYKPFAGNKLMRVDDYNYSKKPNNYGMKIIKHEKHT